MIIFADLDGKGFVNNETVELNICIDSWLIVSKGLYQILNTIPSWLLYLDTV